MHIKVHILQRAGLPYIYIALSVYVCMYLTPATPTTGIVSLHPYVLHRCGLQVSNIEHCCSVRESGNPSDVSTGLAAMKHVYTYTRLPVCVYIYAPFTTPDSGQATCNNMYYKCVYVYSYPLILTLQQREGDGQSLAATELNWQRGHVVAVPLPPGDVLPSAIGMQPPAPPQPLLLYEDEASPRAPYPTRRAKASPPRHDEGRLNLAAASKCKDRFTSVLMRGGGQRESISLVLACCVSSPPRRCRRLGR